MLCECTDCKRTRVSCGTKGLSASVQGAHEDSLLGVVQLGALLDTMSTETGEKNVNAAAHVKALETVVEDTEAELARLQRSKVANMVKMYQGAHQCSSLLHKTLAKWRICRPGPKCTHLFRAHESTWHGDHGSSWITCMTMYSLLSAITVSATCMLDSGNGGMRAL